MEQLLELVLELIGLLDAEILEPRPVVAELGIGHRVFQHLVVEPVQLEREEQELGGDRRDLLLNVAEEFLPRRVGGIGGVKQARIGDDPPHDVVQLFELAHRLAEIGAAFALIDERRELAGIGLLHRRGASVRRVEIGLEFGRVGTFVEVGEIPFGQGAERALAPPRPRP